MIPGHVFCDTSAVAPCSSARCRQQLGRAPACELGLADGLFKVCSLPMLPGVTATGYRVCWALVTQLAQCLIQCQLAFPHMAGGCHIRQAPATAESQDGGLCSQTHLPQGYQEASEKPQRGEAVLCGKSLGHTRVPTVASLILSMSLASCI